MDNVNYLRVASLAASEKFGVEQVLSRHNTFAKWYALVRRGVRDENLILNGGVIYSNDGDRLKHGCGKYSKVIATENLFIHWGRYGFYMGIRADNYYE